MSNTTRITAAIFEKVSTRFAELTRQIGVSGTALLSRTMPAELDYLAALPSNDEAAEKRARVLDDLGNALSDTLPKMVRFNVTLERKDAERMNQICREKRIPRDMFIRSYISFLVNGVEGCEAPLVKISKILANPRYEFEEKRWLSPDEDQTLYAPDGEVIERKAFGKENPYSHLHFDDDLLNALELFMKNRTPENK